jgi:hypothetical protein
MSGTDGGVLSTYVTDNATSSATWHGVSGGTAEAQTYHWEMTTPQVSMEMVGAKNSKNEISARLYFKYVKKNLNVLEMNRLKGRLNRLEKLADDFEKLGQIAMSEECIKQFIILSRESAMWACGFKLFVTKEQAEKFARCIKGETLKITPLKNFARIIPANVVKKVKKAVDKKLFDSYVIFHLDNKSVKETQKEKIEREKDPIIFGKINESDNYYFIGDWEDELDDLRLGDIVQKLSLDKKKMTIKQHIDLAGAKKRING